MADGKYELVELKVEGGYGKNASPRASVTLSCPDGKIDTRVGTSGVGMIDCAIQAVNFILGEEAPRLGSFNASAKASAIDMGSAAPGVCALTLSGSGGKVLGQGRDSDVVVACVKAYLEGINKLLVKQGELRQPIAVGN